MCTQELRLPFSDPSFVVFRPKFLATLETLNSYLCLLSLVKVLQCPANWDVFLGKSQLSVYLPEFAFLPSKN